MDSSNLIFRGNRVSSNGWSGVPLEKGDGFRALNSTSLTIADNLFSSNGMYDINLTDSTGVRVFHNNFMTSGARDDRGGENTWDDGYPSGGNYWSAYIGVDLCSGPGQDVCPNPDGIGDTPYVIDSDSRDRYPLMESAPVGYDAPPDPPVVLEAELTGVGQSDVRLTWQLSLDDGGRENDVVRYEIWCGTAYDSTGGSYTLLAVLPPSTASYLDVGNGSGNMTDRFYQVRAVDASGQSSASANQAGKMAHILSAGLHLLSVPLAQSNWTVAKVFQTVRWNWVRVYQRDTGPEGHWLSDWEAKTWSDLESLDGSQAIWVAVAIDSLWTSAGIVPEQTTIRLKAGWNAIGYASFLPRSVEDVLAGIPYETVEGFANDPPYDLGRFGSTDLMAAGNGYWVYPSSDAVLTLEN